MVTDSVPWTNRYICNFDLEMTSSGQKMLFHFFFKYDDIS